MKPFRVGALIACVALATAACENLPTDLAAYQGTFAYVARDTAGRQIAQGTLVLDVSEDSAVTGRWEFTLANSSDSTLYPWYVGSGELAGNVGATGGLFLNLHPNIADANLFLSGVAADGSVTGSWDFSTLLGVIARGTFRADPP